MSEKALSNYESVPLRSDEIRVCVVQSRISPVEAANPEPGRKVNLEHMLQLIDGAQALGINDLLVFHEFPIAPLNFAWDRQQALRVAIDVPGEETQLIGAKAKQYQCYIHFGCYGKLHDWPGHFMNLGIIIGPSGDIIHHRWKMRNLSGMGFSTTVHDVLDAYVERYGWDAVFPIARTDIGNIAILPEVLEPEMGRVYAMKGAEIVIRYMTGGAGTSITSPYTFLGGINHIFRNELQVLCLASNYYGIFVNNSISMRGDTLYDFGSGASAIINCNGKLIEEVASVHETMVTAYLPMAVYRQKHSIPNFPKDLYLHFYNEEYRPKYPANCFQDSLPNGIMEAAQRYKDRSQW